MADPNESHKECEYLRMPLLETSSESSQESGPLNGSAKGG